jgi:hypothetical protein
VSTARRIGALVAIGVVYSLVGILFAMPTGHVRVWRLAAWGVSAVAFAAHIAYERFRARSPALSGALRVALAVALGAFGLAVGANLHSLSVASSTDQHRRLLLLALAIWPVLTSLPAFLVALAAGGVLTRLRKRL